MNDSRRASRASSAATSASIPSSPRTHRDDRVDDQVQRQVVAVDFHRHRIDQERHVVVDDLDDRVRRLPAVILDRRIEDAHAGMARFAPAARSSSAKAPRRRDRPAHARRDPRDRPGRNSGRRTARAPRARTAVVRVRTSPSTRSSCRALPSSAIVFIVASEPMPGRSYPDPRLVHHMPMRTPWALPGRPAQAGMRAGMADAPLAESRSRRRRSHITNSTARIALIGLRRRKGDDVDAGSGPGD